ncbi:hypothetical protein GCM10023168_32370 [Fodinibacter luteus]|uniref:Protein NO VEIN C-terminal domain-containing protein n=1 Tax=Fodinibacter luteus TaxID=552064 RepID=A0ABP8KPN9_9MICO
MRTSESAAARRTIEEAVLERAQHTSKSKAQDTWSFARAERLLGKEYHGRFLIELLQNAADAWRDAHADGSTCELVVVIDESPALIVANRGVPFPAQIVLESLGQIGLSPKEAGEAIGHKGIGFKSTLEVSATPEIYSTFFEGEPTLAVRFDAARARELILEQTPDWDTWVADQDEFQQDCLQAVPVLRYPTWVDSPPAAVTELGSHGYDTVVRLPHSPALGDTQVWLAKVRDALGDVSDQILVLLGIFDRVRIENRVAGTAEDILVTTEPGDHSNDTTADTVTITRNGVCSSRWVRYHRQYADGAELASEVATAIRLDADDSARPVHAHGDVESSSPFHLFFPTRIGSGLPFLLHGYFEVDAARTGFFAGSAEHNRAILDALADLVVHAVGNLASRPDIDLVALTELITATPAPEAKLARHFHDRVLAGLDDVAWLPGAPGENAPHAVAPRDLLPANQAVTQALLRVFPASYLRERSQREIAHPDLSEQTHRFLADRRESADDLWPALHVVLRPGQDHPWPTYAQADQHFLALLDLADALRRFDPKPADELLRELLGDEEARLVPVARPDGRREFVPVPNPEGSAAGKRGVSVMARLGASGDTPLDPPEVLDVEFLAEGLLTDQTRPRAEALGIRPFTVDAVLDRLNIPDDALTTDHDRERLVRFLWDLLTRERRSDFSTASSSNNSLTFGTHQWFWLQPGRARQDENARQRQRRERNLAGVPLPARDGTWQPAGTLAFGADWANWVEAHLSYADGARRATALRRLHRLAPSDASLLAPPEAVLSLLPTTSIPDTLSYETDEDTDEIDSSAEPTEPLGDVDEAQETESSDARREPLEQFAFLLRLGCWEVPPLEGHESGRAVSDRTWPWPELRESLAPEEADAEWNFDVWQWSGTGHCNITVTEDARLLWRPERGDHQTRVDMSAALADGAPVYTSLTQASALCPSCTTDQGNRHRGTYRTRDGERRPSTLALQLRRQRWLPTTRAGVPVDGHSSDQAWADLRGLDTHAMRTSPLQHLPLVDVTGWSTPLRTLCDLHSLDDADPSRLLSLHDDLRSALERGEVDLTTGTAHQSFVGLHRLIYESLARQQSADQVPAHFEVLCELGSRLVHRHRSDCRHDDGRYVGYRARFAGQVPFVVLARDKGNIAKALDIPTFEVSVVRRDNDPGEDITESLHEELTERIPELLAVMVHHAGGTNPLEPTSEAFRERASRLRQLRVRQLDNLVLSVSVAGMPGVEETIGDTAQDESYLDTSKPGAPVVFHDFTGDGWRGRLRRRLAQHLAAVSDVAGAYTDTFTLLMTASEEEREDLLRSWGVASEHVQQIRTQLGIFTDSDRSRAANWLRAILAVLGRRELGQAESLDHAQVSAQLSQAGLSQQDADAVAHGITNERPGDPDGPVLRTLARLEVNLQELSDALAAQHEPRLAIRVAHDRLKQWLDRHDSRLVAVLNEKGLAEGAAKSEVSGMRTPADLDFALDPPPEEYLSPVLTALIQQGLEVDATALVCDAATTLASLCGWDPSELDERVLSLYDDEARAARLRDLARGWAGELRLLSLLVRASGASASVVRSEAVQIDETLGRPEAPSHLVPRLEELVPGTHLAGLRSNLEALLGDDLPGTPAERGQIHSLAGAYGVPVSTAPAILTILTRDRSRRVSTYTHQVRALVEHDVQPRQPARLTPPPPRKPRLGHKHVAPGKVSVDIERRKKRAGDEAESWAVTAMTRTFMELEPPARDRAIGEIIDMLERYGFTGPATERVRAHGEGAREPGHDEEELIDRLTEFLWVAAFSDGFGFDVLGWFADPEDPAGGHPMALEVKSASGSFFLSSGEWAVAERMRANDEARAAYAVLAVHPRRAGSDAPDGMDLLIDPVQLCESGQIRREDDTYRMRY